VPLEKDPNLPGRADLGRRLFLCKVIRILQTKTTAFCRLPLFAARLAAICSVLVE